MFRLPLLLLCLLVAAGCAPSEPRDRTLAINVRGSVSVSPTNFSGYYIYENSEGIAVRRNLTGSGNFNEVLTGRRVLLVTLRRTSADGLIGLVITSDGNIIYDSGMLRTNESILYEADS